MIKTLHKIKIPDGMRIPYFGLRYNSFLNKQILKKSKVIAADSRYLEPLSTTREAPVIISLTSFPARILYIADCIALLFRQTMPPDRIILWLAEEQFPEHRIPNRLKTLEEYGLEIRYCEDDLKGHKKYYYTMREEKQALIITVDDDFLFPEDTVENLYKAHLAHPDCIICNRAQEIRLDQKGYIMPYGKWRLFSRRDNAPSFFFMASTGAGTLYPPGLLDERVFDKDTIKKHCLSADDIWMKTMSLLKGTKVVKTKKYPRPFTIISDSQTETLAFENIFGGKNDQCMANMQKLFPEAFQRLKEQ